MMRSARIMRLTAPVLVASALAAACSSSSKSSSSSSASSTATTVKVSGTLNGSGSTFQAAYNQQVISDFTAANPGTTINYQAKGSGGGQTDLQNGVVQFAGSDVTVPSADLPKYKGSLLYFPTVAGPITVSYNLSGVKTLQLSGTSLAKIFSRTAKTWNDASIAADNPGVTLPSTAITVVHRSDSSGTTANFTSYLKAAGGSDWTIGSGKTVPWPTDTTAGNGNAGVAQSVKGKDGAIGYVDYSDAKAAGLTFAKIKNQSGSYVEATLDGASQAVANATVKPNLTYDPINAPGASSYPITSPTYIITYTAYSDAGTTDLLKAFLSYMLGPKGQATAQQTDFAALPSDLASKALAQVSQITVGSPTSSSVASSTTSTP